MGSTNQNSIMKRLAYLFLAVQLYSIKCQKNVVLIIADDFRPNVGVMEDGNHFSSPEMITPNLDKLAERSLVLTKAYTQVALCGPSRSSFLTGRRPDSIQCYDNNHKVRVNRPNIVTCRSTSRRMDTSPWPQGRSFILESPTTTTMMTIPSHGLRISSTQRQLIAAV